MTSKRRVDVDNSTTQFETSMMSGGFWCALLYVLMTSIFCVIGQPVAASEATTGQIPANTNALSAAESSVPIKVEYLEEKDGAFSLNQLLSREQDFEWTNLGDEAANFGYRPHAYWYRFRVKNAATSEVPQFIHIDYPLLDTVEYFRLRNGELVESFITGDRVPYAQRIVDHPNFLFPLNLAAGESNDIYFRVTTAGSQLLPITLWRNNDLLVQLSEEDQVHAIYYGIVMVIIMFNLLIFLGLREKTYLFYSLSTFSIMMFFVVMRAKLYPAFFSQTPEFHHLLLLMLPPACLIFASLFTREFLSIRYYSRPLYLIINGIIGIAVLCFAGVFLLDSQTSLKLSVLVVIPGTFILLLMGPLVALMGNKVAWLYTFAWGTFMFGATVTAMSKHGFLPLNFLTEYGMQIGSALEVFILNAALAYRFYREHHDKVQAQEDRLKENAERRDAELKLLQNTMSHPITLMPNRTCFEQEINAVIAQRDNQRIAVCIIEISRYEQISKTLGHHNTDLLLCDVAQHFNEIAAKLPGLYPIKGPTFEANLCSLENASFGLLLNADIAENQEELINQVLREMIKPIEFKEMRFELSPIVGVAICPEHGLNSPTLLRHAQVAVDSSDPSEKSLSYYKPEHDQYNARRLTMISELKEAIRDGGLELYFQPKYEVGSREIVGLEALVRWHHERYGTVRPDEFIPLAEQTGIIRPLTRWVVKEAFEKHNALKGMGFDLSMSINISAMNLRETDLLSFLQSELDNQSVSPEKIYLELTETSMMQNPIEAIQVLNDICKLGIRIAIDDYGSGYSSLAYLKSLPANEIKIDRSLVVGIIEHKSNETIARSTIEMCHELGFHVVAEGVETQDVLDRLSDLNCDVIQGYYFTAPLPKDKLIDWLCDYDPNRRFAS